MCTRTAWDDETALSGLIEVRVAARNRSQLPIWADSGGVSQIASPSCSTAVSEDGTVVLSLHFVKRRKRLQLITREALRDGVAHQFRRRVQVQLLHEASLVKFDGFDGHMKQ